MVLLRYYRRNYCSSSSHRFICCKSREPEYAGNIQSSLDGSRILRNPVVYYKTADKSPTIMILIQLVQKTANLKYPNCLKVVNRLYDEDIDGLI